DMASRAREGVVALSGQPRLEPEDALADAVSVAPALVQCCFARHAALDQLAEAAQLDRDQPGEVGQGFVVGRARQVLANVIDQRARRCPAAFVGAEMGAIAAQQIAAHGIFGVHQLDQQAVEVFEPHRLLAQVAERLQAGGGLPVARSQYEQDEGAAQREEQVVPLAKTAAAEERPQRLRNGLHGVASFPGPGSWTERAGRFLQAIQSSLTAASGSGSSAEYALGNQVAMRFMTCPPWLPPARRVPPP